jgi:hypothetical protein
MERISLIKNSRVRTVIIHGAETMGYSLAIRTNCVDTPIFLYVHRDNQNLIIYNCGLKRDELLIIDYHIPGKLQVIINEYKAFSDSCHREVAEILEKILDGSFFKGNDTVTYL